MALRFGEETKTHRGISQDVSGPKDEVDQHLVRFDANYGNAVYGGHIAKEHPAPEGERHVTLRRWP